MWQGYREGREVQRSWDRSMGVPKRKWKSLVTQCEPKGPIRKENINIRQVSYHQMSSNINIHRQPRSKNTSSHCDWEGGLSQGLQTCKGDVSHRRITYSDWGANVCAWEEWSSPLFVLAGGKKVREMLAQSGAKGQTTSWLSGQYGDCAWK